MERAVEVFVAVTGVVVGLSHLLRPDDWAEAFRQLHRCGRPGAFANGALNLVPGAALVAGHGSWTGPGAVLTAFGWLLVAKAAVCFLVPDWALRSMERGGRSPRGFIVGGLLLLAVAGWACYCLWHRAAIAEPAAAAGAGMGSAATASWATRPTWRVTGRANTGEWRRN
jgi:hypothetical protein